MRKSIKIHAVGEERETLKLNYICHCAASAAQRAHEVGKKLGSDTNLSVSHEKNIIIFRFFTNHLGHKLKLIAFDSHLLCAGHSFSLTRCVLCIEQFVNLSEANTK